jgi:hypothetical protein
MEQLRAMAEETTRIRTRAERLAGALAQEQVRTEHRGQIRVMQEMATAAHAAVRDHERLAGSLRDLIQERDRVRDQDRDRDREMDRDTDRIRNRLQDATDGMNETLQLMERMHDRLRADRPTQPPAR